MERKYEDMRSCWEFGEASECRRGLMLGMGYTEEELNRPLIAVVNSWNEYNPGHVHLNQLAERVKQGIREAGGLPLEDRHDRPSATAWCLRTPSISRSPAAT